MQQAYHELFTRSLENIALTNVYDYVGHHGSHLLTLQGEGDDLVAEDGGDDDDGGVKGSVNSSDDPLKKLL